ncbi:hypothetical protein ACPCHT_04085 [Nucisporomicrobium flavum]|uniref:hypothetical protein n=1 Tax=Nucisporomicrobium flavum TaxID=2785915 RepID=UPI0018F3022A|nr:hypothetical protein [Nucisporomicrobium flavum]
MRWRNGRGIAGVLATLTAVAALVVLPQSSAAQASPDSGRAGKVDVSARALSKSHALSAAGATFAAQGRTSGLTAGQADALQAKADKYLAALGSDATQVGPDKITVGGNVLLLAVPGEAHPRGLSSTADARMAIPCPYTYFCAYSAQWFTGDAFLLEDCNVGALIPWFTTGSWKNNQTSGTQPWLYFADGQAPWHMPGAYAEQASGVGWSPVYSIDPC